jgi:microcystin degradation protein MlrC
MRKIFTANLGTETNTFSNLPTGLRMFEETCLVRGGNYGGQVPLFAAPLIAWRELAEARGWHVIESLCAFAQPAGRTVRAVYEAFRDEILADLRAALPVDAVLLSLHGAMAADGYDDAEGDLISHIRQMVGPDLPIGAEYDLHANISRRKLEEPNAVVLFKEYPHVDVRERAVDLFKIVADAVEGRCKPVVGWFDCRMIGLYHTTRQPMRGFVDRCTALEGHDGILSVSIVHGFPWADVPDMGSKIVVVADGDRRKAERLAEELGRDFFAIRAETQPRYVPVAQAMERAVAHRGPKPLVLADVADNAGGGAPSDSTFLLQAMLEAKLRNAGIAMIWDPVAVRQGFEAGLGATLDLRLGGKMGVTSGPPLDVRATVTGLAQNVTIPFGSRTVVDMPAGDMAAFDVDGIAVVCCSIRTQCFNTACFAAVGVDPVAKSVLAVKSMQHFHASFAPIASDILYVAAPGAVAPDVTTLPYAKASRAQWPFVADPFAAA